MPVRPPENFLQRLGREIEEDAAAQRLKLAAGTHAESTARPTLDLHRIVSAPPAAQADIVRQDLPLTPPDSPPRLLVRIDPASPGPVKDIPDVTWPEAASSLTTKRLRSGSAPPDLAAEENAAPPPTKRGKVDKSAYYDYGQRLTLLHQACCDGDINAVAALIGKIDLHAVSKRDGYQALHYAVYHNHKNIAELLLSHGANLHAVTTKGGRSCLHLVLPLAGRVKMVDFLLRRGALLNVKDSRGKTLQDYARRCPDPHDSEAYRETLEDYALMRVRTALPAGAPPDLHNRRDDWKSDNVDTLPRSILSTIKLSSTKRDESGEDD